MSMYFLPATSNRLIALRHSRWILWWRKRRRCERIIGWLRSSRRSCATTATASCMRSNRVRMSTSWLAGMRFSLRKLCPVWHRILDTNCHCHFRLPTIFQWWPSCFLMLQKQLGTLRMIWSIWHGGIQDWKMMSLLFRGPSLKGRRRPMVNKFPTFFGWNLRHVKFNSLAIARAKGCLAFMCDLAFIPRLSLRWPEVPREKMCLRELSDWEEIKLCPLKE